MCHSASYLFFQRTVFTLRANCIFKKEEETMLMNFIIFLLFLLPENSSQAMTTFHLLGVDRDYPHKTKILDSAWSWRNLLLVQRKAWNQELTEILIQGKNCHHFCCAPARATYGSPADKYNLFSSFFPISYTFHLWNIKTSHKVPVNP